MDAEGQGQAEVRNPTAEDEQPTEAASGGASGEEVRGEQDREMRSAGDELIEKAQKLIEKITSTANNPSPAILHSLSNLLESQESLYIAENGHSSSNGRGSHKIGKLCNLIRDNDEFFELISSVYFENTFSTAVQAASARLLLNCSLTWMYPHIFDESVSESFKSWVMNEAVKFPGEYPGRKEVSDSEMLKTYSTGLLAMSLQSGGQLVEDALTSGLSAKLMRYLRVRVIGETSMSRRETLHSKEPKHASLKEREEVGNRVRKLVDDRNSNDHAMERDMGREMGQSDARLEGEGDSDDAERWDVSGGIDDKVKPVDDDFGGDDPSKRRLYRSKSKGRGRVSEGTADNEVALTSPGSGCRRVVKERGLPKISDPKITEEKRRCQGNMNSGAMDIEREENDECFQGCIVGTKDITDLVKKAVGAAEAEARAANAPADAVKAAGDAAAELVKTASLEEFKASGNEEAAVSAASQAASTVVDAAIATEVSSRTSNCAPLEETTNPNREETEAADDVEEISLPDIESLALLQEKYCIQCLEILGEYVEVLGPVLHEKGVDVCILLLQRNSKRDKSSKVSPLLPDVMKLICALAAHRKFAAMFVDRGGIQKLLAVPRINETFFGLSSCLYTIGSLQGIMERVCALPSDVIHQVVALAIQLLECSQDQARKNAALFFAAAFVFRAILDGFDTQDGLQKFLGILRDAASVRTGTNSDRSAPEVLTSSEKQMAFHTCFALRQYFRAHLLLLVDSVRPNKGSRGGVRTVPSIRAAYKPLDVSNEAVDAVFLQLQKDRKLGPAFARIHWPEVNSFLLYSGHVTLLELCQTPPVDRYLHDLLQYAFGVLHIVTSVPAGRKAIVNANLSNNRVGIAVILDAANIANSIVDPETIQPALNVLINLVCPPPSISNKSHLLALSQVASGPVTETKKEDRNISDRTADVSAGTQSTATNALQTPSSGLVGDRRISLGAGTGSAGLAAQLEQVYRQARQAVRTNNGIKILLNLLQPRIYVTPPASPDCLRALACRVLLGLARDDAIAQILTKLQVGKRLSELIRDSGGQTGTDQGRWQAELAQVALELIAIVTNSGRATTLTATDAATPTLRRIERAAIAAATPVTYDSKELLLLIHEHLQASGLSDSAMALLKEAELSPLPSLAPPSSIAYSSTQETLIPVAQQQWPSGRVNGGFFFTSKPKVGANDEEPGSRCNPVLSGKKKPFTFSPSFSFQMRNQPLSRDSQHHSIPKLNTACVDTSEVRAESAVKTDPDAEAQFKTPIIMSRKRKLSELKDSGLSVSGKRMNTGELGPRSPACATPVSFRRNSLLADSAGFLTPASTLDANPSGNPRMGQMTPASQQKLPNDPQPSNPERLTLDSLVVQYLKHQHRQCPAPITTLPPLSLLHPHVCPEPKRALEAPLNITGRLGTRELQSFYEGVHGNRRDRQFVFSRFKPWRTCRDEISALLTCVTFLGDSSHIAVGSHSGELKVFDSNSGNVLESCSGHQSPVTIVQSYISGETQLLLSSSSMDVRLWDASSITSGPMHSVEGCKSARFSNSGTRFAALSCEAAREILLYDVGTCKLDMKLTDTSTSSTSRGHAYSLVHFNPSDSMILWNGSLWDPRVPDPIQRLDQFSDYGGGGFHPSGNEVIINSEVWDLRNYRLLRSVPSLDQTTITFNSRGDVIYAILRRNLDDVMSAVHMRRVKHPLFAAFRTIDAVNYSDIATIPVDRCVLDFAMERTDSFAGLITMDDQEEMLSSARIYEIGRRRPTDDDSDPDDAETEDEDEDDEDDEGDLDPILGPGSDGSNSGDDDDDDISSGDEDESASDLEEEERQLLMGGGGGLIEIFTGEDDENDEDDNEEDDEDMYDSMSSGDDYAGNVLPF
ncbi:PREDICTED: DDB1- and CUL4-associated factor homolog 1-like isoform X1 [Tarenaya hassleriana]|uniref:DDB1- and CUL4-associated factor homolog 1-like isoform X1 n=1 Tax=Tarenaya hassleriana TaxID=28532 RepID=UPI00053C63BF|nr:PREDICTED: DDB1- and CUL4-associated factor homolog 1-like isoform X1 [Tarenaya hassleriana]